MANRVLFLGWNRAIPGREKQGMDLFQKTTGILNKWQADGRIERFEVIFLSSHGGDLNGFWLLYGTETKLAELRQDKTFLEINIEAGFCLDGYGLVLGYTGEGLAEILPTYSKLIGS
jgi:hypothetical protein